MTKQLRGRLALFITLGALTANVSACARSDGNGKKGKKSDKRAKIELTSAEQECRKLKAEVKTRTIEHEHHENPIRVKECLVPAENAGEIGSHVFETEKQNECTSLRIKFCSAVKAKTVDEDDADRPETGCFDYCKSSNTFVRRWKNKGRSKASD